MATIIGVRFKNAGKLYYFDPGELWPVPGNFVIVETARGMEYEYGKYYIDPEDGKTYLCKRGEETGSIVLYYLPHELIGQYFEEA